MRRMFALLLAIGMSLSLLTGCGGGGQESNDGPKDSVTIALTQEPALLDPQLGQATPIPEWFF